MKQMPMVEKPRKRHARQHDGHISNSRKPPLPARAPQLESRIQNQQRPESPDPSNQLPDAQHRIHARLKKRLPPVRRKKPHPPQEINNIPQTPQSNREPQPPLLRSQLQRML